MYLSNSPLLQVQDEVGASPIDIARAYMGSRRLEKGYDSCSLVSKGEQVPQNRFHPPPSLKSSTCWPAAMLQDQHSHITPQSQRGYGLVEFPRTPYSRTLLPKSRDRVCIVTKFRCVYKHTFVNPGIFILVALAFCQQTHSQTGSRWPDLSAKTFQQSQSSIYSQVYVCLSKSKINSMTKFLSIKATSYLKFPVLIFLATSYLMFPLLI